MPFPPFEKLLSQLGFLGSSGFFLGCFDVDGPSRGGGGPSTDGGGAVTGEDGPATGNDGASSEGGTVVERSALFAAGKTGRMFSACMPAIAAGTRWRFFPKATQASIRTWISETRNKKGNYHLYIHTRSHEIRR